VGVEGVLDGLGTPQGLLLLLPLRDRCFQMSLSPNLSLVRWCTPGRQVRTHVDRRRRVQGNWGTRQVQQSESRRNWVVNFAQRCAQEQIDQLRL
jgi:hypothetical protein